MKSRSIGHSTTTAVFVILAMGALFCVAGHDAAGQSLERVSVNSDGVQADSVSYFPSVSADGRLVAFSSDATNLVEGDTNRYLDIFVHARDTGQTERVSLASDGTEAIHRSDEPSISADGRFVAFRSEANNLVADDTNIARDIFVHDRQTGQTQRVSIASDGTEANGNSYKPCVSADGRFVAFESSASNLVAGDTNGRRDIFVHDRQTGQTQRVSIASDGTQADKSSYRPPISADGNLVAFMSDATNLIAEDTNAASDVFVHNRQTGQTERVSVGSVGAQANARSDSPSISGDGQFVAFYSEASNLVAADTNEQRDIFVRDRGAALTKRVSVGSGGAQADGWSDSPSLSDSGRLVAFRSGATNLTAVDTNGFMDIFLHDRQAGKTERVSLGPEGEESNMPSSSPSISADGRFTAFSSEASNLVYVDEVPADTNSLQDIFVYDKGEPPALPGDANGDCRVDILDMIGIRNRLNADPASPPENAPYDVTEDGAINILDMIFVRNRLNNTCL